MSFIIYTHEDCLNHKPGEMHPENPGRIEAVLEALQQCDFAQKIQFKNAPMGNDEDILLVHPPEHLEHIRQSAPESGSIALDGDTIMSEGSLDAAYRAVGAGSAAVDQVMTHKNTNTFCLVRPPGHHASQDQAMGFCFFNNIAIAARYALKQHKLKRVAIVDFDVHHGNGTQDIFLEDSSVLYISTHQSPLFPGTGKSSETGEGNILNVELPNSTEGNTYRQHFLNEVIPALEQFKPELLLVSAGFDAHRDDPLAGMNLTEDDYHWIGKQLHDFAKKHTNGRMVSMLEGGYNHQALANSVVSYIEALI